MLQPELLAQLSTKERPCHVHHEEHSACWGPALMKRSIDKKGHPHNGYGTEVLHRSQSVPEASAIPHMVRAVAYQLTTYLVPSQYSSRQSLHPSHCKVHRLLTAFIFKLSLVLHR